MGLPRVSRSVRPVQESLDLPAPAPVRRAIRPVVREGRLSTEAVISAEILQGDLSEADFREWVQEAMDYYCRYRNGWVGRGAIGKIICPTLSMDEEDQ